MTAETASEEITLPTNEYNSLGTKMASEEITELLPCPFCGNAPLVDNCGEGGSSIRCRTFMCPLDDIEVSDDTIEDVTKRWNRRDDRHAQRPPEPDEDQEYAETMRGAAQLLRLDSVLRHYADTYCEGWCKDAPSDANFNDCGGCRARLALRPDASAVTSTYNCPEDK